MRISSTSSSAASSWAVTAGAGAVLMCPFLPARRPVSGGVWRPAGPGGRRRARFRARRRRNIAITASSGATLAPGSGGLLNRPAATSWCRTGDAFGWCFVLCRGAGARCAWWRLRRRACARRTAPPPDSWRPAGGCGRPTRRRVVVMRLGARRARRGASVAGGVLGAGALVDGGGVRAAAGPPRIRGSRAHDVHAEAADLQVDRDARCWLRVVAAAACSAARSAAAWAGTARRSSAPRRNGRRDSRRPTAPSCLPARLPLAAHRGSRRVGRE